MIFDRFEDIEKRYIDLSDKVNDPEIIADNETWRSLVKEQSELMPIVDKYKEYTACQNDIDEARAMLADNLDDDFKALVKEELAQDTERLEQIGEELKLLLLPKDPNDEKNVVMEIRGGAGGNEANLFAGDLFRMYSRYAERQGWKVDIVDANESELGGFREISFMINGKGAYSRLKYESGVHRVQRVPTTESGGRIHTSTATVAVMPEVEAVDVKLDMNDCKFDVFRASGNGGQCVNTTDSAVRLTHFPTGIVISCQDEKSQLRNKEKALKVLMSRLYDMAQQQQHAEISAERKSQIGRGNRNERIRTYNFPQGRVTDHRIGLTLYKLDAIIDGDLDEITDALITTERAERLKEGSEAV